MEIKEIEYRFERTDKDFGEVFDRVYTLEEKFKALEERWKDHTHVSPPADTGMRRWVVCLDLEDGSLFMHSDDGKEFPLEPGMKIYAAKIEE